MSTGTTRRDAAYWKRLCEEDAEQQRKAGLELRRWLPWLALYFVLLHALRFVAEPWVASELSRTLLAAPFAAAVAFGGQYLYLRRRRP